MRTFLLLALFGGVATAAGGGCAGDGAAGAYAGSDGDSDVDSDGDADSDGDGDADTDTDADGDGDTDTDTDSGPPCDSYESTEEEDSPIQTAGAGLPDGAAALTWSRPASYLYLGDFAGTPGNPASHEGVDYVHGGSTVATVDVTAAADGEVVYVRLGCPQSGEFTSNTLLRECGAGWGNHVVVDHGSGIFTRYAHLKPDATVVLVGDAVERGELLGLMGNSGRSEVRHLHFELGSWDAVFDPCAPAQSLGYVYDSEGLTWE